MITNTLYPHDIYTASWLRATYGPIIATIRNPIPRNFVHPEEHRCRSLIRSHRDMMHFLIDHRRFNLEAQQDERIDWYIHKHAMGICRLIACIRVIRQQLALGIPVKVVEYR